jgi:hypothetical protein
MEQGTLLESMRWLLMPLNATSSMVSMHFGRVGRATVGKYPPTKGVRGW